MKSEVAQEKARLEPVFGNGIAFHLPSGGLHKASGCVAWATGIPIRDLRERLGWAGAGESVFVLLGRSGSNSRAILPDFEDAGGKLDQASLRRRTCANVRMLRRLYGP